MTMKDFMKHPIILAAVQEDKMERAERKMRLANTQLGFGKGKKVRDYTITGLIQGSEENGISEIWDAVDGKGREVVIKRPALNELDDVRKLAGQFEQEAQISYGFRHRNIVTCPDIFYIDHPEDPRIQVPHIVLERLEMGAEEFIQDVPIMARRSTMNEEYLFRLYCVMSQVADGLAYMHQQGIVHCDFNLRQVMLDKHETAKIMDFGTAKRQGDMLIDDGELTFTPHYFPRDAKGQPLFEIQYADPAQDLYASGMSVIEMLLPVTGLDQDEISDLILDAPAKEIIEMVRATNVVQYHLLDGIVANCFDSIYAGQGPRFTAGRLKDAVRSFGLTRYLSNRPEHTIDAMTRTATTTYPKQDYRKKP